MATCGFCELGVRLSPSLGGSRFQIRSRSFQLCSPKHRVQSRRNKLVGMGTGVLRQGSGGGSVWSGRNLGREKRTRRGIVGPVGAIGEDTMWVTASASVALVLALAAFAVLGGYFLSMGVENEFRSEEEEIEKMKEMGSYKEPEKTQYEEQGVGTRARRRRISKE